MRQTTLLALASVLAAATAHAGDLRLVGEGQVIATSPTHLSGPLAGISAGDAFDMSVEVFDTPTVTAPGFREYPQDPSVGGVQVGATSFTYDPPTQPLAIIDSPFAGDQLTVSMPLAGAGSPVVVMSLSDASGATLGTADLAQLVGSTFVSGTGSAALIAGLEDLSTGDTVVVFLDEIRVEDGGPGTGGGTGPFCVAAANSTGGPGVLTATGSFVAADNDLTLQASNLPAGAFGFFITSRTEAFVVGPAGSQGNLCLGGGIGRYVGPGQIQSSGASGTFALALDLTQTPTPASGFVAIVGGQTWSFQAWHRDSAGGVATSNFTSGFRVAFQ